ncbi:HNH endonuclease signature motif containing protein [uncultured Halomonas sp.]|uniref:HNH endonuclease signature motif containing protein n=1 Tax=uncultured Halomonas sp. TaxID=173971 RepID=UPI00259874F2|nr:HNH endonuclease signature motif containing protein [uncultured Halomonas sp.]
MSRELPSIDYLKECLSYNHETGGLTWRTRPKSHFKTLASWGNINARFAGKPAGTTLQDARCEHSCYVMVRLAGRGYLAHRIAWAIYHGEWPSAGMEIDHISGDSLDNRIANLRLVDHRENARNQRRKKSNSSGVCGVHWHAQRNKWQACIKVSGKNKSLGMFERLEDAAAARKKAEREHGYHLNHGRVESWRVN